MAPYINQQMTLDGADVLSTESGLGSWDSYKVFIDHLTEATELDHVEVNRIVPSFDKIYLLKEGIKEYGKKLQPYSWIRSG